MDEHSMKVLTGFVFGASSFISKLILGVFENALMAMLYCVAIDMDLHKGIPIYGPPTFRGKTSRPRKTVAALLKDLLGGSGIKQRKKG